MNGSRPGGASLLAAAVWSGLAACVQQQKIEFSFDDAMAARAKAQLEPGEAAVKGSAFLRKPSGSFATAGGEWVYLIPATPYAEERFRKLFSAGRYNSAVFGNGVEPADPRYGDSCASRRRTRTAHSASRM